MIRRMIVMLVVLGVVLGGYFDFQQFKAKMIHGFLASMANPPQTVSTVDGDDADLAAGGAGGRQPARGERRRRCRWRSAAWSSGSTFQSGDDVQAGQVLLRLRADDDTAKLAALEASAALAQVNYDRDLRQFQRPGGQPGGGRLRTATT